MSPLSSPKSANPDLEIVVITYNRANYLRQTLAMLQASPFRECQITVLDNCSTDDTHLVTQEYQDKLNYCRIVRHTRNIGGNANIVRAYEISRARYLWVMGDDDEICLESAGEVIDACRAGEVDLINLWMPDTIGLKRGVALSIANHARENRFFFFYQSFITGVITRTDRLVPMALIEAYAKIHCSYPQLAFSVAACNNDGHFYVPTRTVVKRGGDDVKKTGHAHQMNLAWYFWWCEACEGIADSRIKRVAMDDGFSEISFYRFLWNLFVEYKSRGNAFHANSLLKVASYQSPRRLVFCLALLPLYLAPSFFFRWKPTPHKVTSPEAIN